jgi:SNF2 family DNA or RNA helicase
MRISIPQNKAWVNEDRIFVAYKYNKEFVEDCKMIPGRKWHGSTKTNSFPLSSIRMVRDLIERYGVEPTAQLMLLPDVDPHAATIVQNGVSGDGSKLFIRFPYDPDLIRRLRSSVPAVSWNPIGRYWETSINNAVEAVTFAKKEHLAIDPYVESGIKDIIQSAEQMREASSALEGDIEIEGLAQELMPYQKAGVLYLKQARRAILGDQPGLGKTVQALATLASEHSFPAVVVCPNTLKLNWEREANKFFPGLTVQVLNGTKAEKIPKCDLIVINYDILHTRLDDIREHGFVSLVADESHAIKNGERFFVCPLCNKKVRSNQKNCGNCLSPITPKEQWTVKRAGAVMALASEVPEDGFVILLTGTPITNRPMELATQLEAIGRLHNFGGRWRFKQRYAPKKNLATNTKELNDKMRSFCFVRRIKQDVYGELPPLRNAVQLVSPEPAAAAWYAQVEADVVEYLATRAKQLAEEEGSDGSAAYWEKKMRAEAAEHLVRITVLRDAVSKIKFDAITKWLDNFLESGDGEKVIVFAEHIDFVEKISARYGDMAVKIRGGVSVTDRQAAVDRFQTDPTCRVFVGNMAAASEGLTLTAASDVVFCELAWTPAMHEQCASRAWGRINDMHGCTAWYLLAPNTIDLDMYDLLENKKKIVAAVTDGVEPGVEDQGSVLGSLLVQLARRGQDGK